MSLDHHRFPGSPDERARSSKGARLPGAHEQTTDYAHLAIRQGVPGPVRDGGAVRSVLTPGLILVQNAGIGELCPRCLGVFSFPNPS